MGRFGFRIDVARVWYWHRLSLHLEARARFHGCQLGQIELLKDRAEFDRRGRRLGNAKRDVARARFESRASKERKHLRILEEKIASVRARIVSARCRHDPEWWAQHDLEAERRARAEHETVQRERAIKGTLEAREAAARIRNLPSLGEVDRMLERLSEQQVANAEELRRQLAALDEPRPPGPHHAAPELAARARGLALRSHAVYAALMKSVDRHRDAEIVRQSVDRIEDMKSSLRALRAELLEAIEDEQRRAGESLSRSEEAASECLMRARQFRGYAAIVDYLLVNHEKLLERITSAGTGGGS
ncbi:MAG: hypothetical protein HY791_22025 [Deltaproteobacteria bacterium]|nr:hypothetical protein [Deltaproteobacteria bacterium]